MDSTIYFEVLVLVDMLPADIPAKSRTGVATHLAALAFETS
jgi:hypothetical protein